MTSYKDSLQAWRDTRGQADARRLVLLHIADCIGNGVYFSTCALYLNRHSGLGALVIGVGIAVGAACGLFSNLAIGRLADARGPRRILTLLLLGLGASYCTLPLVSNIATLICFSVISSVFHFSCGSPFVALIGEAFPDSDRARGRALIRSFGNAGMAVGAAGAAVLLAVFPHGFLDASPFVNGASFIIAGLMVATLKIGNKPVRQPVRNTGLHAAFSSGMPGMILATSVLGLHSSLLAVGVPLWISVTHIAPTWVIPVLIGINTIIVVLCQIGAAEYAGKSFNAAIRASRAAGLIGITASIVIAVSAWHRSTVLAITAVCSGFILLTIMELLQNGATFYLGLNIGPDSQRAEYASAFNLTEIIEGSLGPLLIGFTFAWQDPWSWLIFAGLIATATAFYGVISARISHLETEVGAS